MFLIIPIAAGFLVFVDLLATQKPVEGDSISLRRAFIGTMILLGVYVAISSEVLSLLHAISTAGVALSWLMLVLVALTARQAGHLFTRGWRRLKNALHRPPAYELVFIGLIGIVLMLTFLTGLISPPNNYDSLLYHLPRVAHWIQSASLSHHATAYINQLSFPIWAEEAILHTWLLGGGDAFSFFVQWLAFVGCIVCVTEITRQLTANRLAQWLAAFFALSLPAALLQSSSTQNDLVTAFWFACLLLFLIIAIRRPLSAGEMAGFAGSLALGMLTKATFYPYAGVPLVFFSILTIRRMGWKKAGKPLLLIALFCLVLNAGYWGRNLTTFGNLFGSQEMISANLSSGVDAGILLNPFRNFALNLVTPSEPLNKQLFGWMFSSPGQGPEGFPPYWVIFSWNDEDYAGNPLHAILLVITLLILIIRNKRISRHEWIYFTLVSVSYGVLCFVIQYNPYFVRYELPFFIAVAPIFGAILGDWLKPKWVSLSLVFVLFLVSFPWLLINKTRPLIALRDYPESLALKANWVSGNTAGSILLEPAATTFFARIQSHREPYLQMAEVIKSSGCKTVGLRIDSSDPEYPFWWVLGGPMGGYRIESIYTFAEAASYLDDGFQPCAVICTICLENYDIYNLDFAGIFENAFLYLGN
jgi:hypothetical protein